MVQSDYQAYLSTESNQLFQIKVGLLSILFGILLSSLIIYFIPQDLSAVLKAREMGIYGKTVIDGYPKQSELSYYIIGVIISLISSFSIFFGITYLDYKSKKSKGSGEKSALFNDHTEILSPRLAWYYWFGIVLSIVLITFSGNYIYKNWYWAEWGLFFEEGIYFHWLNEMLRGNILYREVDFHGGPFLIWPQYWLMKLLGPSMALHRYYGYFCYLMGYLIVFKISHELIKSKVLLLTCMLLIIYFNYPMYPSHHESLLRYAFSLLPLYYLYKSFYSRTSGKLLVCGICTGFALSYSQELGMTSLVALLAMLLAFNYREESLIKGFPKQFTIITIGIFLLLAPIAVYFYHHNALIDLYEAVLKVPQDLYIFWLGMPFPNLFQLFNDSDTNKHGVLETILAYWPIVLYVSSVFLCMTLILRKYFTNRSILLLGIAALGTMMLQRAFGIYSLNKIEQMIFPLIIVGIVLLEMNYFRIRHLTQIKSLQHRRQEIVLYFVFITFLLLGLAGYAVYGFFPVTPVAFRAYPLLGDKMHYLPLKIARAENIYVPPQWVKPIREVKRFIVDNTQPDEPIFVFPYAPLYYFLTNRPSATKLSVCSASQRRDRNTIIRDIEDKKVKYIIYTQYMKSVLGVKVEERFPEIISYINNNYEAELIIDDTIILKRKNKD